jgi:GT2 family glycosyltransferase/glycosyltransferase involved in cell wall biosynthesis
MRVLLIVHGFPPAAAGGTEIYTHDLARALRDRFGDDVFVLTREADPGRPEYGVRRESRDGIQIAWINNTFRETRGFEDSYRSPRVRRSAEAFIDDVRPDVAHVQHLTCLSTELVSACARRGVPVVVTLNDYWLACHRGQFLDVDHERCPGASAAACARCIGPVALPRALEPIAPVARRLRRWLPGSSIPGVRFGDAPAAREAAARLSHMRALAAEVAQFLAPSQTLRQRFIDFGVPADRLHLQEQGIDQTRIKAARRQPGDRLRVGFLGSLMISKAPHLLLEAVSDLPERALSVHLFGSFTPYHGDDRYRARLEPLLARPAIHHAGPVPHDQVGGVLASLDVLVVPSIWIENAPFVIREAFAAGVPVIASNLGGMAELVSHERSGLLFEPGSADDLRRSIRRLLDEPGLLDRLRRGVPRMKTMEEDAAWTRQVYTAHLSAARRALTSVGPPRHRVGGPRLAAVVLNYRTAAASLLATRGLQGSARRIDDLIVVDNGSGDGSEDELRRALPDARVLQTGENLGFAGGCNAGIRAALESGASLIALINSDVILPPDALARLEDALAEQPSLGVVGPLILSRAHPARVASSGMTYSPATGRMRHPDADRELAALSLPPVLVVEGVSGCVMLVRREVFERIGLLTEDYFFSFEDLDFCLRARAAGFGSACVTGALAYHEGGGTIGRRSAARVYFATRNHLALGARAGGGGPAAVRAVAILGLNLAHVLTARQVPRLRGLAAFWRGARDHFAGRYGPESGSIGRPAS